MTPLAKGEEAYGEMLAAIEGANKSVSLQTYIFDNDEAGLKFVHPLGCAKDRGVEVRVPSRVLRAACGGSALSCTSWALTG